MKLTILTAYFSITAFFAYGQEQKVVGDCTVTFSISGSSASTNTNLSGALKTVYIKGKLLRVDISGASYPPQSVIYNSATGEAVILQQMGANKYMSKLTPEKWNQENSHYEGAKFILSGETKTILGYECKKMNATLKDGGSFILYYAPAIIPSANENPYLFKDIPGFVLQYEVAEKNAGAKITYTATKINFSPVPASKFDIPTSGYLVREN
jgi:GLPGLI family protein